MKQIPNLFTLLNCFFGCCAIVMTLQNGIALASFDTGPGLVIMPETIWLASLFIGLAALVDFFDGFLARWFKAESLLGKQLDSLADVVSFGVAPSLIIYQFLRLSYAQLPGGLEIPWFLLTPAFIPACAAAYRLGKFNIDERQASVFKGVPTPAAGLLVASFPLIYWYSSNDVILRLFTNRFVWYGFIILISWLMVSNITLLSLKMKSFKTKDVLPQGILLIIGILGAVLLKWWAVPILFISYIAVSLIFKKSIA